MEALGDRPLSGIITNAGLTTDGDVRSKDSYELTFAVNVLAHQLLLVSLMDQVVEGGRVVVLSSGTHDPEKNALAKRFGIPKPRWVGTRNLALPDEAPEDARVEAGPLRYTTSKLGNVVQARGMQRALHGQGRDVDVFAVDPGLMVDTNLMRGRPWILRAVLRVVGSVLTLFVPNMRRSTTTAEYLTAMIAEEKWHGKGFQYFDGIEPVEPSTDGMRDDLMEEFWQGSGELLGLRVPESVQRVS
jgi:NAD(P)-dependent dehydrogenase (short-subunit alcohol dehydrogenase family)